MKYLSDMELPSDFEIEKVKGFLDFDEGETLYRRSLEAPREAPCLEIGSYCGKSACYIGAARKKIGSVLYSIDHHRGSEEHQPGEEYHDPELYDSKSGLMDSLPQFRDVLLRAGLENVVIPVAASSATVARYWLTPLSLVFIDGGHSQKAALADYRAWAGHLTSGGILAIHDIFPDPSQGGRAPYEIWKAALSSGLFEKLEIKNTLGILRRI